MLSESIAKGSDYLEARLQLALAHKYFGNALNKDNRAREALDSYGKALQILDTERMRAGNSPALARLYADMGDAETSLASKTMAPETWREAKGWYQRSVDIWKELEQQGSLKPDDAKLLAETLEKISKCDAALTKGMS